MGRSWCRLWLLLPMILVLIRLADSSSDKTIHIGYLLQYFGRAGAINVAIEHAQNDGLLRDYNFRYNRLLLPRYDCFSSKSYHHRHRRRRLVIYYANEEAEYKTQTRSGPNKNGWCHPHDGRVVDRHSRYSHT